MISRCLRSSIIIVIFFLIIGANIVTSFVITTDDALIDLNNAGLVFPFDKREMSYNESDSKLISNLSAGDIIIKAEGGEKFALIVVGRYAGRLLDMFQDNFQQYYSWYLNSAGMMYSMLRNTYGYSDENIFLLVSLKDQYDIPSSFNPDWIDYESNKENLKYILAEFKPGGNIWMENDDSLFFTFINHGLDEDERNNGKYAHNTFFGFPYKFNTIQEIVSHFVFKKNLNAFKLYDWELGEYLENIHAGKMIFILQPCYSGGFINDISGINRIICTSSRESELATVEWIEPFIHGLNGNADANGDEKISILEAYEYTARNVNKKTKIEHPLLDDNDDGIGHHYSEVGYDPTNPNSDGYVAARTFL